MNCVLLYAFVGLGIN